MKSQANADRPGQVMLCDLEQLESEAKMVVYAVIVKEEEEGGGQACIQRIEVPGSFLQALLRVLLVPSISFQHGLRPRNLIILGINPIGSVGRCLSKYLSLDGGF